MNRKILAFISWPLTALPIFAIDAVMRRQDLAFYEPRSDRTAGNLTTGLFESFGTQYWWLIPLLAVLPMGIILWKTSRKWALLLPLIFFVIGILVLPFAMLIYVCVAGIACI